VFESRVLKKIFGPKRYEVTGNRRKLHNKERHNLRSMPNSIRMMKSVGIPTGYKLDDPGSIPGRVQIFLFSSVQTGSGAHPTSYTMGNGGKAAEA
jgi:hypothetical protein